jgi:hypothetical protein
MGLEAVKNTFCRWSVPKGFSRKIRVLMGYLKLGKTSLTPMKFGHFCKYPIMFKNSYLPPLNFQLLSIWTHLYKLGHKIFLKDQNTPDFYFKKNKKISGSWNFIQKSPFKIHYLKFQLPKCFF